MTLRTKTLAVIVTTLVLMMLILFSITESILLGGYAKLEKQNILQNVDQVERMIDYELDHLSMLSEDWGSWDDTYQFVQDINHPYIDNNLMDEGLVNLRTDFMIYKNTANEVVYSKFVDPETGEGAVCPDSLITFVSSDPFLIRSEQSLDLVSGLVILPENPVFVVSAPILSSQDEGPTKGRYIVGRYITPQEISRLSSKIDFPFKLQRMDLAELPPEFEVAKRHLSTEERIAVVEIDDNTIAAYALLSDLSADPILLLGIDKDRKILAQGKTSLNYFFLSILVIGLVFVFVALLSLEITVLSRVVRLNTEVKKIGRTGDLSTTTTVHGHDELATLASEINQMLESVRVSTERDRAILESIEDGYYELDLKGNLTFFNESLSKIFRYKKENFLGVSYRQFNVASEKRMLTKFNQLYKTGTSVKNVETGFTLEDGEQIFIESSVSVIKDATGVVVGFRGIARDVTDRKRVSEKLFYMAYHDCLTGFLNRKAFHENLAKELIYATRYAQQRSLLFLDLDNFKKVNDTYGHDVGDQLLKKFSHRMEACLRNTDMAYRLGGDEFAVILPDPQEQLPDIVAQRIVEAMEKPFQVDEVTIDFVSVSIGVSIFPLNGTDVESLLSYADKAMYTAKKRGRRHMCQAQISNAV